MHDLDGYVISQDSVVGTDFYRFIYTAKPAPREMFLQDIVAYVCISWPSWHVTDLVAPG
jgi:hypothetical protein